MVDAERAVALLERIAAEVAALRRALDRPTDEILASEDALPAVKYRVVVAVEAAIDVARHVIASEDFRRPDSFADTFAVLAEEDLLDVRLAASLGEAAGLRNLLVHQYAEVDDRRLLEGLPADLDDLDGYVTAVARFVDEQS